MTLCLLSKFFFFFSSRRRHTRLQGDWSSDVCSSDLFLVFLIFVASSRFGDIRLGPDDAEPEFSFISWTAMLFAAGMGIGLMYFGVGEPLQHFLKPPTAVPSTQIGRAHV